MVLYLWKWLNLVLRYFGHNVTFCIHFSTHLCSPYHSNTLPPYLCTTIQKDQLSSTLYHILLFLDAPQLLLTLIQSPSRTNSSISQIYTTSAYTTLQHALHWTTTLHHALHWTTLNYYIYPQHILLNYYYFISMFKGRLKSL